MRAIVMLHGIDDTGSVLSLTRDAFAGLVGSIGDSGHSIVPLSQWFSKPDVPNQIALTFDDGFRSLAESAAPVLRAAGLTATLFLTTGFVGRDNRWPSQPPAAPVFPMLDWDQVEALHRDGWEIEPHSVSHPDLRRCTDTQLDEELDAPAAEIERRLGRPGRIFAYPYGYFDERCVEAVRSRFDAAVSARLGTAPSPLDDRHRVPRIDAFYLRDRRVYRAFGTQGFAAYLKLRAVLRRARNHPAELA